MARFGKYETVDELFHTPFTTVYSARAAGATGPPQFVVKVYDPSPHGQQVPSEGEVGSAAEFLEGAQQNAASHGSHWATIHDLGMSDGKAFYVTDLYSRTAQKLIVGRIALTPAGLYHVIAAVTGGLRELRDAGAKGHGNLKPSNVLISGAGEVAGAKVVLTDPVRDPAAETETGGDMHAVGTLIYQLVMNRPFRHVSWPIPDSPEWTRLGEAGDLWRTLCSSLLNPELPHRTDLDGLERSLVALEPRRLALSHVLWLPARLVRRVPFGKAAVAILLLAIAFAAMGAAYVHQQETASRDRVRRARELWLDPLRTRAPDVLARASAGGRGPVIPIADEQLIDAPEHNVTFADFTPAALENARRAQATVEEARARVLGPYNQAAEQLRSLQSAYLNEGLVQAFASVELSLAEPEPDDDRLLWAVRKRLRFADRLAAHPRPQMKAATAERLTGLEGSGDKALIAFAKTLRESFRTAAIPVGDGWESTPLVDDLAAKVAAVTDWPVGYAGDRLKAEEHLNLEKPTLDTIRHWLVALPRYAWVHPAGPATAAHQSLVQSLDTVDRQVRTQLMRFLTADSPLVRQYEQERAAIRSQVDALSSARFVQKDLPQSLDKQAAALHGAIDALPGKYKYVPGDLAAWWDRMNAQASRFKLPAAREFWRSRIAGHSIDTADAAFVRTTDALAATVTQLDEQTFRVPATLADEPWAAPVTRFANQQLAAALAHIPAGQTAPDPGDLAGSSRQFATWCAKAEKLKQDYTDLHDVPITANTLKLLDGHWSAPEDRAFWHAEVESSDGAFAAIMKPELDRIDAARRALKTSGNTK